MARQPQSAHDGARTMESAGGTMARVAATPQAQASLRVVGARQGRHNDAGLCAEACPYTCTFFGIGATPDQKHKNTHKTKHGNGNSQQHNSLAPDT